MDKVHTFPINYIIIDKWIKYNKKVVEAVNFYIYTGKLLFLIQQTSTYIVY